MKARCAPRRSRLKIRAAPLSTLKGILVAEQFPPHLTSPGQPFSIRVTLQLEGQTDFRKILPVHVTGVDAHDRGREIPLLFKCGSGPNKHKIGRRTALELTLKYEESASLHQNRAFAVKIEIDAARARKYNLAVVPLLLGPTTVVRESTVEEDGLAFSHTLTGESAADARQRLAEERGEVCDLTGEGEGERPAKKKFKVVHG